MRRYLVVGLGYALLLAGAVGAETMFVKVKQASLKEKPRGFSKELAKLPEGTQVETLDQQGTYLRSRTVRGVEGWVHQSSLEEEQRQKITGTGTGGHGRTSEEVAAATKGWNEEVERGHRSRNRDTDRFFRDVDEMERWPAYARPFEELESFRREGCLGEFKP
ncbi:MAG: SH3 domain-containing protein [Candidatus Eisenbacteria bacterium]